MNKVNFGLIIDTEQYAGNFERELCAYLTGKVGACGVGQEMAEKYIEDVERDGDVLDYEDFFENVCEKPDEHGCYRPCEIYPTEGWFGNGFGGGFRDGQEVEALEHYKKTASEYYQKQLDQREDIKSKLLSGEKYSNWTVEACDREIQQYIGIIEKIQQKTEIDKCDAYNSVLIHFSSRPTEQQIEFIRNRISGFAQFRRSQKEYHKNFEFTFTGLRLLEEVTKTQTYQI